LHRGEQTDPRKGENFDKVFTRIPIRLTPIDERVLQMNARGDEFRSFSIVNPCFVQATRDDTDLLA